jgi:accessory gene regulator protein AgrB
VIKKPRERGGHSPRWAAELEKKKKKKQMMMVMIIIIIIIIIIIEGHVLDCCLRA